MILSSPDSIVNLPDEQWRDIPGYEGRYQVSDQGRVWSLLTSQLIKPYPSRHGYLRVTLRKDGGFHYFPVHKLVALTFIGPRPADCHIDHINRNRLDNRLENLRYLNRIENSSQGGRKMKGTRIGERNPISKLTNAQRCEIVALYDTGQYSHSQLAKVFKVCDSTIGYILSGKVSSFVTGRDAGKRALAEAK